MQTAVAIMSFDRPEYLRATALSVRSALEKAEADLPVFLFQDGAFNSKSGLQRASFAATQQCIVLFRDVFPDGEVLSQDENLGVALNFRRAEEFLFDKYGVDQVIFFEDDMVIDSRYVTVLLRLLETFSSDPRVGLMACYGANHAASAEHQKSWCNHLAVLTHFWAFALTRTTYLHRKALVDEYLLLLEAVDYMQKDAVRGQIHALQSKLGFAPHVASQDMFKCMAMHHLGLVNVNTHVVLGSYIGESGAHCDFEHFCHMEYDKTVILKSDSPIPNIAPITDFVFQRLRYEQTSYIEHSRPMQLRSTP